jgi:hypothetical protein
VRVGDVEEFWTKAVDLVSECDANRESGLPFKEINCCRTGFDGCDLQSCVAQPLSRGDRIPVMFPCNYFLGAQGRLRNGFLRRMCGDSAQA